MPNPDSRAHDLSNTRLPSSLLTWAASKLGDCPPAFRSRHEALYWLDLALPLCDHANNETRLPALWIAARAEAYCEHRHAAAELLTAFVAIAAPDEWRPRQALAVAWCADKSNEEQRHADGTRPVLECRSDRVGSPIRYRDFVRCRRLRRIQSGLARASSPGDDVYLDALEHALRALQQPITASDPATVRTWVRTLSENAVPAGSGCETMLVDLGVILSAALKCCVLNESCELFATVNDARPPWAEWLMARLLWAADVPVDIERPLSILAAAGILLCQPCLPDSGEEHGSATAIEAAFREIRRSASGNETPAHMETLARKILNSAGALVRNITGVEQSLIACVREARCRLQRGEFSFAVDSLQREREALSSQPALVAWFWQPILSYWLGCGLAHTDGTRAERLWRTVTGPLAAAAEIQRALAALARGDVADAAARLESGSKTTPAAIYASALVHAHRDEYWDAINALDALDDEATANGHWQRAARVLRASLCERWGRLRDAERQYRRILADEPDDAATATRLARLRLREYLTGTSHSEESLLNEVSGLLQSSRGNKRSHRMQRLVSLLCDDSSIEPSPSSPLAKAIVQICTVLKDLEAGRRDRALDAVNEARRWCRFAESMAAAES